MEINGVPDVPVDVRTELESYEWERPRWLDEKLIACSPFRQDSTPSFYVWLRDVPEFNARAGYWGDSGGVEYQRGNFVTLLAYLRGETEDETARYLLDKYAPGWDGDFRNIEFDFSWIPAKKEKRRQPLPLSTLKPYMFRHPYLGRRGISEAVQRAMRIGYDRETREVIIPWFNYRGELVQIKRRSVRSKFFRFLPMSEGGFPVRELVYAIDVIYRKGLDYAVVTEAEIDALYAMTCGFPAIAVGGARFSREKADVIRRSPLRRLIIAADNDDAGRRLEQEIVSRLAGEVDLWKVRLPEGCKDLNDVRDPGEVSRILKNAKRVEQNIVIL